MKFTEKQVIELTKNKYTKNVTSNWKGNELFSLCLENEIV